MTKQFALSEFKSIAIIQTAFIGDVALVLYLAELVRINNPNAEIYLITTKQSSQLGQISKAITETIIYDKRGANKGIKGIFELAKYIKTKKIDLVLAPHRSLRTTLLTKLIKPRFSVGFDKNSMSFLYDKSVKYIQNISEIKRNYQLLSVFNDVKIPIDINAPKLKFEKNEIDIIDNLLNENSLIKNEYAVLAPGSVWNTKRWNEEYFSELIIKLQNSGIKCILSGATADEILSNRISDKSGAINLAGKTNIAQSILLLKNAKFLVSNDSAPIHFAGLVNCKTYAIFGPTIPEFGFAPQGKQDIIIENKAINCRPCGIHGHNKCPIKTHICMNSISAVLVFETIIDANLNKI